MLVACGEAYITLQLLVRYAFCTDDVLEPGQEHHPVYGKHNDCSRPKFHSSAPLQVAKVP